jgi:D-xylose transport system substrate-binding protein
VGRPVRISISGRIVRLIVACVVASGLSAACAASNPSGSPSTEAPSPSPISNPSASPRTEASSPTATQTANGQGCLIGVSWYNYPDLMDWEGPALQTAILGAGVGFKETDAKSSVDTQRSDIDRLVAAGAKVIVIEPGPEDVILQALQRATSAGIPVVTVFWPLEHVRSLYVAFDPVEQGRQEARGLLAVKPKGDYAIIKGDSRPPESELIASGIREILQPAIDRGDIRIVAEVETPDWDPTLAQQEMTAILRQNGGSVDAVAIVDDFMASFVENTLGEAGLTGRVAVGGVSDRQGASLGLSAIVRGTQAVDAWGNPERLGEAAAHAAIALCHDPDITRVDGSTSATWPGRDPMTAILLAPLAITRDNLGIAVETNPQWRKVICGYDAVPAPDWAPACQGWTPQP